MDNKQKTQSPQKNTTADPNIVNNVGIMDDLEKDSDTGLTIDYESDMSGGSKGGQASSDDFYDYTSPSAQPATGKGKQGFASMSPAERSKIARIGGIEAHKQKKAHEWDSKEAKRAGKIGGSR